MDEDVDVTGSELILTVMKKVQSSQKITIDLAKLNLILFLIEGDGQVRSTLEFVETPAGPRSNFVAEFVKNNKNIISVRTARPKKNEKVSDSDYFRKLQLTEDGMRIAANVTRLLPARYVRIIEELTERWIDQTHGQILTYICLFYPDFCTSIAKRGKQLLEGN
ncbi:MAG: hypothetical protein QXV22_01725 [Thermoplasmataceae archaeon]